MGAQAFGTVPSRNWSAPLALTEGPDVSEEPVPVIAGVPEGGRFLDSGAGLNSMPGGDRMLWCGGANSPGFLGLSFLLKAINACSVS